MGKQSYERYILTWRNSDGTAITDRFKNMEDLEVSIIEREITEQNILEIIRIDECTAMSLSYESKLYMKR